MREPSHHEIKHWVYQIMIGDKVGHHLIPGRTIRHLDQCQTKAHLRISKLDILKIGSSMHHPISQVVHKHQLKVTLKETLFLHLHLATSHHHFGTNLAISLMTGGSLHLLGNNRDSSR